ncbi:hypothetical protein [Actinoplanes friuliensis]|uniref:Uncharacterized protein n=1 Tax=Actinoplanes friuliensis DSM 7358 TaxID=1246995 RepID=U5W5C4_9ACTN|nr:hypothetical protein [Actinoplanes friuliensis]AGZ44212.1 hypothetical protein AFR_29755 [Actinoplanes friuliensis DSM 7358]
MQSVDRVLARHLAYLAFIEIRSAAGGPTRTPAKTTPAEALTHIRFLSDLCHNLPLGEGRRPDRSRTRPPSRREVAMRERPMSWTWNTAGPQGQAWILAHVAKLDLDWTPPPPLPTPYVVLPPFTLQQRMRFLARWPVGTPREQRVLKVYDNTTLAAHSPQLAGLVDPGVEHYVFPDPSPYDAQSAELLCRLLLRMVDGAEVTSHVRLAPEVFAALPSSVPFWRQRLLAHRARLVERDLGLWTRDRDRVSSRA